MKLYLLSSEEHNSLYNLSYNGENKIKKINIHNINFDTIFVSPLKCCLQTIDQYVKNKKKSTNIEYSLCEFNYPIHNYNLNIDELNQFNINEYYNSFLDKQNIYYPEDINLLQNRMFDFLNYLNDNFQTHSILLVTHNKVINNIIHNFITDYDINNKFDYGCLVEIFLDNEDYKLKYY